jgi:hypothetical protein
MSSALPAKDETDEALKNPVTASTWKALPDLARQCICMIVDAAQSGHLDMFNGVIAITVRQRKAITLNPSAELRPGHEIMRQQPQGRLYDALRDRAYPEGGGPSKEDASPASGQRAKLFDGRHVPQMKDKEP